ncbi:MAG: hypothetical protein PHF63_12110 [Herbinix sp.]|nr:hypothetical protein [Herbinix sp.]
MLSKNYSAIELTNPNYVPVIKDSDTFYGGSQMWFPADHWYSKDYIIHNYGCGTIATADLFLYLAQQKDALKSPATEIAFRGSNQVNYDNYDPYVRTINDQYTKTLRIIAVLGPKIASAINTYANSYGFEFQAFWKLKLTYYDMLDIMEEMLLQDIPVILSIGPNTPNLWGKKGIPFYKIREINYQESDLAPMENEEISKVIEPFETSEYEQPSENKESSVVKQPSNNKAPFVVNNPSEIKKPYYYKVSVQTVNSHYVTVTGIIKDAVAGRIMLCISSWGQQYYINYEEYRDYIDSTSGTYTSSIVQIKK